MATLPGLQAQPVLRRERSRSKGTIIVGIETSCDDTGVALVRGPVPIFNKRLTSAALHFPHGGIVPEIASRSHLEHLPRLLRRGLSDAGIGLKAISAIGVTVGPGLMGSLLVGVSAAKGLALGLNIPLLPINHLEAHLHSPFVGTENVPYPFLALIVSGGHTELVFVRGLGDYEVLGRTLDDSAGEAIDKIGRVLGLGFPAGPRMDEMARFGNPQAFAFPEVSTPDFSFSYSGLKTSALRLLAKNPDPFLPDFCASFQSAIFSQLLGKLERAISDLSPSVVAVVGGVAANSYFRDRLETLADRWQFTLAIPPPEWCTDNGLMVAYTAYLYHQARARGSPRLIDADPSLDLGIPTPGLSR
ncbi:MAG: tRNA (adenosine(37)-N6)-threonylcarbamoyltransferase complex transferase subunit TsaD [bacterium JZ-2024 1]